MSVDGKRKLQFVVGFIIGVASLSYVITKLDWQQAVQHLLHAKWAWLALGVGLFAVGYAIRVLRWKIMFSTAKHSASYKQFAAAYLASIALNNTLPLRAGDVLRVTSLSSFLGIKKTESLLTLLFEKVLDLGFLLLLAFISALLSQEIKAALEKAVGIDLLRTLLITLVVATVVAMLCAFAFKDKLLALAQRKFAGVNLSAKSIALTMALTPLVWFFESMLFACVGYGLGIQISLYAFFAIMTVVTLSTMIPSTPGYFGTFHLVAFSLLPVLGAASSEAGAYAFLTHFLMWLPTTLVGLVLFFTTLRKTKST